MSGEEREGHTGGFGAFWDGVIKLFECVVLGLYTKEGILCLR